MRKGGEQLSWPLLRGDLKRSTLAAGFGALSFFAVEFAATLVAANEFPAAGVVFRLLALYASLALLVALTASLAFALVTTVSRLLALALWKERGRQWRGLFGEMERQPNPLATWLWSAFLAACLYLPASTLLTTWLHTRFREATLVAILLAGAQLALFAALACVALALRRFLTWKARFLSPLLGRLNPLRYVDLALLFIVALCLLGLKIVVIKMPQMAAIVSWRHILALCAFALGAHLATTPLPTTLAPKTARSRLIAAGACFFAIALLLPVSLVRFGADMQTKLLATSSSPSMNRVIDAVRKSNDFDRDGYGSLLGENDCKPFDPAINRGARDIPDNGIDENCDGRDFSLSRLATYKRGARMPVPEEFQKPWNILLLTVDTVRYDHTSFGGYIEKTGRDTTPNLAKLVERSVSFTFCQAPSAGTMASIPAILTSKFFHSGIALDESYRVPKLKQDNVLISEFLKTEGYTTGALLTHYYFEDWGMEQGFDTYDNSLGPTSAPMSVTSDKLTDNALEWLGKNSNKKWFLWLHYLDPHGRYVDHPGETSYGTSEEDRYDGELSFTDKHIGRLLEEVARMPSSDRTIIVVTSDHGDGFGEHGEVNHGMHLYREVLHVPMIFFIPNLPPRQVGGATSPLDILPTVADLAGADTGAMSFEGESLVPQLFYGAELKDRVVFSETNYRHEQRAAITQNHKLIFHLKQNTYELYDLESDPWEQKNIWRSSEEVGKEMRGYLDDWLERVYYSRDFSNNQVTYKLKDLLLEGPPTPAVPVAGRSFDDGAIAIIGFDLPEGPAEPGAVIEVPVYFEARDRPSASFRMRLELGHADRAKASGPLLKPGKVIFPTNRWKKGDYVRELMKVKIPKDLEGESYTLGLSLYEGGKAVPGDGEAYGQGVSLGTVPRSSGEGGADAGP